MGIRRQDWLLDDASFLIDKREGFLKIGRALNGWSPCCFQNGSALEQWAVGTRKRATESRTWLNKIPRL